jgi:hypothetical protein
MEINYALGSIDVLPKFLSEEQSWNVVQHHQRKCGTTLI